MSIYHKEARKTKQEHIIMKLHSLLTRRSEITTAFKQDYAKTPKDLELQAKYLIKLANDVYTPYTVLFNSEIHTKKWSQYVKTHGLYNAAAVRAEYVHNYELSAECLIRTRCTEWQYMHQEAGVCPRVLHKYFHEGQRELFIEECTAQYCALKTNISNQLKNMKSVIEKFDIAGEELSQAEQSFVEMMGSINEACTEGMKNLTKSIITRCLAIVGIINCHFEIIGFGSLAREEMTPYSDLEFMILVDSACSENCIARLHHFSVLMYFLIANLKTTTLKCMAIDELKDWFIDTCPSGFKIDGLGKNAGNMPTGNGLPNSHYLIRTPESLFDLWKEELRNPIKPDIRGDLSDLFSAMALIYSNRENPSLLQQFQNRIYEDSAFYQLDYFMLKLKLFRADLETYSFMPGTQSSMPLDTIHHVKRDMYRLPSILLFDIKIILGIKTCSASKTLLYLQKVVGVKKEIVDCLKLLAALGSYIRLSAYDQFTSQKDDSLSFLEPHHENASSSTQTYSCPENVFQAFTATLVPLRQYLLFRMQFSALQDKQHFIAILKKMAFKRNIVHHRLATAYYRKKWIDGIKLMEEALTLDGKSIYSPADLHQYILCQTKDEFQAEVAVMMVGDCYDELEQLPDALNYYNHLLSLISRKGETTLTHVEGPILQRLSITYKKMGKFKTALEYSEKSVDAFSSYSTNGKLDDDVGKCYLNSGNALHHLGDYHAALKCYKDAELLFSKQENVSVKEKNLISTFISTANTLNSISSHSEAGQKAQEALQMCNKLYGVVIHPDTIQCLHLLISSTSAGGESEKAVQLFNTAVSMLRQHSNNHADVGLASLYNDMAAICQREENFEQAQHFISEALQILEAVNTSGLHDKLIVTYKLELVENYVRLHKLEEAENILHFLNEQMKTLTDVEAWYGLQAAYKCTLTLTLLMRAKASVTVEQDDRTTGRSCVDSSVLAEAQQHLEIALNLFHKIKDISQREIRYLGWCQLELLKINIQAGKAKSEADIIKQIEDSLILLENYKLNPAVTRVHRTLHSELANLYATTGNLSNALKHTEKAIEVTEDNWLLAQEFALAGSLHSALGNLEKEKAMYEKASKLCEEIKQKENQPVGVEKLLKLLKN